MPFAFELSVSGLCLLTFKGAREKPDEVNVLVVKTTPTQAPQVAGAPGKPGDNGHQHDHGNGHDHDGHHHFPLLTYSAADLTARSPKNHKLVPAANGQQIAQRNLEGKGKLELVVPGLRPGIEAVWHPDAPPPNAPASAEEEKYLNWIPTLRRVDPDVPAPGQNMPFAGLADTEVTAWIRITQGKLLASQVARGISGQYVIWDFKTTAGVFDHNLSQALAGKVILRLDNLDRPVQIRGLDGAAGFIELAPPSFNDSSESSVVRASITNLPDMEVFPSPKRLSHFAAYFGLVAKTLAPDTIRLPETASNLDTTVGSFCPPGSHT